MTERTGTSALHSRRAVLTARPIRKFQIASLLIQARPERMGDILPLINSIPGAEAHPTEVKSRLIVTLEMETDSDLVEAMSDITALDGVISTSLVYHQIEDSNDA